MIRTLALFSFVVLAATGVAQESAVKAPALPPAKAEVKQGLTLTLSSGGKTDTRDARLVALYVPAGQPASPFLAPGSFTARWDGNIMATLRSEYTFSAEVRGKVSVTINGTKIIDGAAPKPSELVQLNNRLIMREAR